MSTEQFPFSLDSTLTLVRRLLSEESESWTVYILNRNPPEPLHRRTHRMTADLWCHAQGHRDVDAPSCDLCWEAVRLVLDEHARAQKAESDFYGYQSNG